MSFVFSSREGRQCLALKNLSSGSREFSNHVCGRVDLSAKTAPA
jgi:hypothetical protein